MAFLIDTSVWGRIRQERVREQLADLASNDAIWTCRAVDLEVTYGNRSHKVERVAWRRRLMLDVPITPNIMNRSLQVAVEWLKPVFTVTQNQWT